MYPAITKERPHVTPKDVRHMVAKAFLVSRCEPLDGVLDREREIAEQLLENFVLGQQTRS
jgi:hypothetical protein